MSTFVRFRDANFTNEEGAGKILAKIVGQAVVVGAETSCRVEEKGGGADDTVDVQVGEVIIIDDDGYAIGAWSDAIENLPVTSNSSGNPRIDVVVAYIDKAVEDVVNNNSPDGLVFAIVDGTPAGAPTPPNDATIQAAVGADNPFIKLAQIAVADSFVSIIDANITDIREQFSIQSGGKKLQYDVANNLWTLEDSLAVDSVLINNDEAYKAKQAGGSVKDLIKLGTDDILRLSQLRHQSNITNSTQENVLIQTGWGFILGDGSNSVGEIVTWPTAFGSILTVLHSQLGALTGSDPSSPTDLDLFGDFTTNTEDITTSNMRINCVRLNGAVLGATTRYGYSWMVIGTKA